ncbi:long-chain-fatty-acid--CoA ligase [Malassezia caprae]|uniref:Long-chain-fatty-acid--CoA ligase n=1 Tax=Malassezia caprae TaxID=1381934 RepID=A0AAF0IVB1_9BASI|nr:long-chain-fatty-acid--CoA ligase [Malassezia caprae]
MTSYTKEEIAARWAAHLDKQMVELPNSKLDGYTPVYRNAAFPESPKEIALYDAFLHGMSKNPQANCLGHRPWDPVKGDLANHFVWRSYQESHDEALAMGSAMCQWVEQGLLEPRGDKEQVQSPQMGGWVGAYWGNNRPEASILSLSLAMYSRVTVGLYDNFDAAGSVYILQHSKTRVLVCPSQYVPLVLRNADKLPALKAIVLVDQPEAENLMLGEAHKEQLIREWASLHQIHVFHYNDVIAQGRKAPRPVMVNRDPDAVSLLCYTSGTTGLPKAARILNRNGAIALEGLRWIVNDREMVSISYLPLAHILERGWEMFIIYMGGSIGYFSGKIDRLTEDLQLLKPTMLPSVPRVLNRIAGQIQAQMDAPGLKGKLLTKAVNAKLANYEATGTITHPFWDRLVFRKVRAMLGGRIDFVLTGSAPCRKDVLNLLRVALCVDVREAYGQTENCAYASFMAPNDRHVGCVGPVNPGVNLRLRDCPELGYYSTDKPCPRGEIMLQSSSVFGGYDGDQKKTDETLIDLHDGKGKWLATGDVGQVDQYGRLQIIDRVKNLIKLAQGEYIAIEKVESIFASLPIVQQVWLYGDSLQPHLVAVAVPQPDTFATFVRAVTGRSVSENDTAALEEACRDPKVVEAALREFIKLGKNQQLGSLEQMRALKLRMEPFSPENGLMTPTLKVKRQEAAKLLKSDLDQLYAQEPYDLSKVSASKL